MLDLPKISGELFRYSRLNGILKLHGTSSVDGALPDGFNNLVDMTIVLLARFIMVIAFS